MPAVSAASNKSYAQAGLTTWEAVINHWQRSIGELASEIEHGAAAVVLSDANDLRQGSPADFDTLLDVLSEASASWAENNLAFWAFMELPGGGEEAGGEDEEE